MGRPSHSTVSEDDGIRPRTVANLALSARRSNHSTRSHPLSARSHPHSARSHPHSARSHPNSARTHSHSARSHPHSTGSHPHSARSHPHSARSHPQSAISHPLSARSHPPLVLTPKICSIVNENENSNSETIVFKAFHWFYSFYRICWLTKKSGTQVLQAGGLPSLPGKQSVINSWKGSVTKRHIPHDIQQMILWGWGFPHRSSENLSPLRSKKISSAAS